ncbi:pantetheinase-like [Watersipora subatra]|uniref:pantetheinase-like n=1 Tax=Watersipora subatra TaxID=2589382 RepID=UPI00355B5257
MEEKLLLPEQDTHINKTTSKKKSVTSSIICFFATTLTLITLCLVFLMLVKLFWLKSTRPTHDSAAFEKTFKVGAYEHKLVSVENASNRAEALKAMKANLEAMQHQAKIASELGVKVLVFPEYGITGNMGGAAPTRSSVYPYMEEVSEVNATHPACVACDVIKPGQEGQTTIGCMAAKYNMYILANLVEAVPCDPRLESLCPSDHHYQYNTNIIYDPKGCLIAKYHKYHRFAEEFDLIDKPEKPEHVYFDTEYGRFGTFICADILYEDSPLTLVEDYNVDHILFPTYWIQNGLAFLSAVDWQLAYATLAQVNFVGAGVYSPDEFTFGSSILRSSDVVNCTSIDKSKDGILITGDLPYGNSSTKSPLDTSSKIEVATSTIKNETASIVGDLYNVVMLEGLSGSGQICQSSLCCSVTYSRNSTEETYILGAFKGIHRFGEVLAIEICLVTKCANSNLSSCSDPVVTSHTAFSDLKLGARFSVHYVYPNLTPSNLEYLQLNWTFQHSSSEFYNSLASSSDWPLAAAALVGRDFDNDPPVLT